MKDDLIQRVDELTGFVLLSMIAEIDLGDIIMFLMLLWHFMLKVRLLLCSDC